MKKTFALLAVLASAGSVQAADLPARKSAQAPALAASQWGGLYWGWGLSGVQGEALEGRGYWRDVNGTYETVGTDGSRRALAGEMHLGYNFQRTRIVYGLELAATVSALDAKGVAARYDVTNTTVSDRLLSHTRTPLSASLLGRMGYTFDQAFVYVTAGPTVAQVVRKVFQADDGRGYQWLAAGASNSFDKTRLGWSAGAGVDYKLSGSLSARAQYLFTDLGTQKYNYVGYPFGILDQGTQKVRTYQSAVTLGLSYALGN